MARIQARAAAMQLLYERLEGGSAEETLGELIGFTEEKSGSEAEFAEDRELIEQLVNGVANEADVLDQTIAGYLRGWTLDRIARVDLCVLRLALYCLQHETDTPAAVIIKEAVDMAGRYSTEKSGAFVNGVLSAYLKDHEGAAD